MYRLHTPHLIVVPEEGFDPSLAKALEGDADLVTLKYLHQPSILSTTGTNMEKTLKEYIDRAKEKIKNLGKSISSPPSESILEVDLWPTTDCLEDKLQRIELENLSKPAVFYRYARPSDWKNDGFAGPCGGICFMVDLDPVNERFTFSYSLCSDKDHFSFKTARKIAEGRMKSGDTYLVVSYNSSISVVDNIFEALRVYLSGVEAFDPSPKFGRVSTRATTQSLRLLKRKLLEYV